MHLYTPPERLERLAESIQIIRSLFEHERTNFEGKYYQIRDAPLNPKPVQGARLPVLIGGGGEKVTLRLVARYADAWNVPGPPELLAQKGRVLDEHCQREGRDPASVWRTGAVLVAHDAEATAELGRRGGFVTFSSVSQLAGLAEQYMEAGASELIIHFDPRAPLLQRKEWLSEFMQDVAPRFA